MVTETMKGTKVVLKLKEGSQTISDCNPNADNAQLFALAAAVAKLEKEGTEEITKVVETKLMNE